jgi:hypothetical protein
MRVVSPAEVAPLRFTLVEEGLTGRLELTAEGIELGAWVREPVVLELQGRTGAPRTVALSLPALNADFSTREKQNTRDEIFRIHRWLVRAREALVRVEARRAEVLAQMARARPALWALAAEFPRADGADEISALSAPLLALGATQEQAQRRAEHLRTVIAKLEGDPALVHDQTTWELKAELADLELNLPALNDQVALLVAQIRGRARAAGLEDALLARADFLLGQYPQSGIAGTFEHLLREALQGTRSINVESLVQELTARMAGLSARLNWYEREPVLHQVATQYGGQAPKCTG